MIAGRPKVTSCLHCGEPPIRKGKCKACWTKTDTNNKRKRKGLPYEPLPVPPRECCGRSPKPSPQPPQPVMPVSVTMIGNVKFTQCPPNFDIEFQQRGIGRIEAIQKAAREWIYEA